MNMLLGLGFGCLGSVWFLLRVDRVPLHIFETVLGALLKIQKSLSLMMMFLLPPPTPAPPPHPLASLPTKSRSKP